MDNNLFWGVFDGCMLVSHMFYSSSDCCSWVKCYYTYKEWQDAELTVTQISVDSHGSILEFTDQINPFD